MQIITPFVCTLTLALWVALCAAPAPAAGQVDARKALAGADVPALIEVILANADLGDDIVLRIAARERLAELGRRDPAAVVPPVMTALQALPTATRQDQQRRISLIGVLADIGPGAEAAVPMLSALAADPNERNDSLSLQVGLALANIGTPEAEAARDAGNAANLAAWAAGADATEAHQAAAEHAFLIRQELRSPQPGEPMIAASLDAIGADAARMTTAAPTLLRAWADPRLGAALRGRIASTLAALGTVDPAAEAARLTPPELIDDIIADTRSPYPLVNSLAMMELGRIGPSDRTVAAFTEALSAGRNPGAAALELGQFGEAARSALPALVPYLADDVAGPNAIIAVGRIGDPEGLAVAELRRIVATPRSRHRGLAASALGELNAAEAVADIASALDDDRKQTRILAARALGEIGPAAADAVPNLAAVLANDDDQVRVAVATSLGRIGAAAAPTASALASLLDAADARLRQAATTALQAIDDPTARQALAADATRYADADAAQYRSLRQSAPHRIDNLLRDLPEVRRRQLAAIVAEDGEFEIALIGAWTLVETGGDATPHLARLIARDDAGIVVFAALARSGQVSLARDLVARLRADSSTLTSDQRDRVNRALQAIGEDRLAP